MLNQLAPLANRVVFCNASGFLYAPQPKLAFNSDASSIQCFGGSRWAPVNSALAFLSPEWPSSQLF